jgi:translocation and assembly module TamB
VQLGDEVWLRSREANIKLGGSLNVQRSTDPRRLPALALGGRSADDTVTYRLALDGVLRAERGTYNLNLLYGFQREFQVEGGSITFYGTSELVPELNISALHTVKRSNEPDLRIRVRLTGPLYPNPIISLESGESYAMSQSDLVSYLIFGLPSFALGAQDTRTAQLAAQTLIPSGQAWVSTLTRGWIGPWSDYLQLRPGALDAQQFTSGQKADALKTFLFTTRLGTEFQLAENVFMSFSTGLCTFDPTYAATSGLLDGVSGKFEYRFSPFTSLKAGREPPASALNCNRPITGRAFVPTPSQWGLSLFRSWRF